VNDAELVIDHISGFVRDRQYQRRYLLDRFNLPARTATPSERLEPFERYRRAWLKWSSRRRPFERRRYVEQEGFDFDNRLLRVKVDRTLYLDGLWLSESYFRDADVLIRQDLQLKPPTDTLNQRTAGEIRDSNAVAVHVRWFDAYGSDRTLNVSADYYDQAISLMEGRIDAPRYFVFSDNPEATRRLLTIPADRTRFVCHNREDDNAHADLWLMTLCRHFITANSSFSWWGAWLAPQTSKIVVAPDLAKRRIDVPDSRQLVPQSWLRV
jgi:hypothetical protein